MEQFGKGLAMKVAASSLFYPLAHIKALMQLGYEPFPLALGKKFGLGREVYFLPNAITYGNFCFLALSTWETAPFAADDVLCASLHFLDCEFYFVLGPKYFLYSTTLSKSVK